MRPNRTGMRLAVALLVIAAFAGAARTAVAQATGTIRGTVTRAEGGTPLYGATVRIKGTGLAAATDQDGHYTLARVPSGAQVVVAQWVGFKPRESSVALTADGSQTVNFSLEVQAIILSNVVVQTASRSSERVVDAPAAVDVVNAATSRALSSTSQLPLALNTMPNVDVAQNDFQDFNLNAHGFNKTFNRRILVLQDGRDLSLAFLGTQEWSALSMPMDDMSRIEMVRGPGSALYGANAFNGVLNMVTPPAREVVGSKLTVAGGEYDTRRLDVRHAAVIGKGEWAYRANFGYSRSATLSRSRTNINDLAREYAPYVDTSVYKVNAPFPGFELGALNGQTKSGPFGTPGPVTGSANPLQSIYGSLRLDRYAEDGGLFTVEAGTAQVQNETQIAAIGRVQYGEAARPWARLAWGDHHWDLSASYSGRTTLAPGHALASGAAYQDVSAITAAELQYHTEMLDKRARVVLGASTRLSAVNSRHTLIPVEHDMRNDKFSSAYGQVDYALTPTLRFITAARVDGGDLVATQFSPKAALSWSPDSSQSVHLTVNKAFQMPNMLEFFVKFPAGAPADLSLLEGGMRQAFGSALNGVAPGTLFSNSAAVPSWVLGNDKLKVERVSTIELGYKRQVGNRVFVTVDAHYSQLNDFVTDVLPGVNPAFAPWTAPAAVPASVRPTLEQAVRGALIAGGQPAAAAGMTRLGDGTTAFVFSFGNAGKATERGVALSVDAQLTDELRASGNVTVNGFDVDAASLAPGSVIIPNTPGNTAKFSLSYEGRSGLDAWLGARLAPAYDWASGTWVGKIPPSETLDASVGYQWNRSTRAFATVTNVFDQRTYQVYGGTIIGRRAIAGVTLTR